MNLRLVFAAALIACGASSAARADIEIPPVTYPKLAKQAAAAEGFVPAGWRLETKRIGDLNAYETADHEQTIFLMSEYIYGRV